MVSGFRRDVVSFRVMARGKHTELFSLHVYETYISNITIVFPFYQQQHTILFHLISTHINSTIENIGARRLHTILEKILDEISFDAPDKGGEKIKIDKAYVDQHLGDIAKDKDLSKFIL